MAYLNYNCDGYLGRNKGEREKERKEGGKYPWEKERAMMGGREPK